MENFQNHILNIFSTNYVRNLLYLNTLLYYQCIRAHLDTYEYNSKLCWKVFKRNLRTMNYDMVRLANLT